MALIEVIELTRTYKREIRSCDICGWEESREATWGFIDSCCLCKRDLCPHHSLHIRDGISTWEFSKVEPKTSYAKVENGYERQKNIMPWSATTICKTCLLERLKELPDS